MKKDEGLAGKIKELSGKGRETKDKGGQQGMNMVEIHYTYV